MIITYNCGKEFLGHAFKKNLREKEYENKPKCATTVNMQEKLILKEIIQYIDNLVNKFNFQKNDLNEYDPFTGILESTDFSVKSTYHTTLQSTTAQLVFGRSIILNNPLIAHWGAIMWRKKQLTDKSTN